MPKSSFVLVGVVVSFFASAVVAEKESSSFDVEFTKSNQHQRLYKWYLPFKHFSASRYFTPTAATSRVNEGKNDQTRRVFRDDRGRDYDIGQVGPVYTFVNPKTNFKWGLPFRVAGGSRYGR